MRILYVGGPPAGFADLIFEGHSEARGMPSFIRPLRELIARGHEVDFILNLDHAGMSLPFNLGVEWLRNSRFIRVRWEHRGLQRLVSPCRLYQVVRRTLSATPYDFVYGQGSSGVPGVLAARRSGVPCGVRLYGTFRAADLERHSRLYTALRHPLEYLAFTTAKDFLLVTNDGTRGDYVHQRLVPRSPETSGFYFWLNGTDLGSERVTGGDDDCVTQPGVPPETPFLFYPARLAYWKRQHLGVEVLKGLHDRGHREVELYLAGHCTDAAYWPEVQSLAQNYGLGEHCRYLGTLPPAAMRWHYRHALAVLSLYETTNLGNVVIEALTAGSLVVAADDGSLDHIIADGVNGLLVKTPQEAAERLAHYLAHPALVEEVRRAARERASLTFWSWEQRAEAEIELIERAVGARQEKEVTP